MSIFITKKIEQATVVTHSSVFHADEAFCTAIMSEIFSDDIYVLRTFKVPEELSDDVVVFDIGGGEFDHHQKGGNGCRENGVPYAAAGLLWKVYGPTIVANTCNPKLVWELVDRDLIQGIDAVDNGVMPKTEYPAHAMTVSGVISSFNPRWNEQADTDEKFLDAVGFAKTVFENVLASAIAKAEAQSIVDEAIDKAEGQIMVLDRFVPWQEFVFSSTQPKAEDILFVVFPSNRGGYNWQCVPDAIGSFGQRKPVPEAWKGLCGEALQEATGVETAIFCHPAGFIGSAETQEDAIKLARMAIES